MSNQLSPTQQQLAALLAQAHQGPQGTPQVAPPIQPAAPAAMAPAANPFVPGAAGGQQMGGMQAPGGQAMNPIAAQAMAMRRAQLMAALQGQGLGLAGAGAAAAAPAGPPGGALPAGNVNGQ